jgi:hypothetical protein
MNQEIYEALVSLARTRQLTSYSDIAPLANLDMSVEADRDAMSFILEDIARFEHDASRPMLTALVIHRGNDNNPGEGFYAIAQDLGIFNGSRDAIDRTTFWAQQVSDVHEHWQV